MRYISLALFLVVQLSALATPLPSDATLVRRMGTGEETALMRAVRGVSSDVKGEAMMRMNQAHTPVTSKAFTEREAAIRENELARQMYPNMESAMAEVDQHGNNSPYVAKARVLAALLDGDDGAKEVLQRKGVATDMPLEVIAIAQKYSKDREGRRPTL